MVAVSSLDAVGEGTRDTAAAFEQQLNDLRAENGSLVWFGCLVASKRDGHHDSSYTVPYRTVKDKDR